MLFSKSMKCFSPARFVGILSYTNQFYRKRTERYKVIINPAFNNVALLANLLQD